VPEEDQISGVGDFFKDVEGILYRGDENHAFDDEEIFVIDRSQYDVAQGFASKWEQDKIKYSLARNNCTTFVIKDGQAAGVAVPQGGFLFDNPAAFGKSLSKK
jgi:hypothetical protein